LLEQAAGLNGALKSDAQWWRNQLALLQVEAKANKTNQLGRRFEQLDSKLAAVRQDRLRALYLNERGLWRSRLGEFDRATADLSEAARLFDALKDQPGRGAVTANQALLLERQARFDAAAQKWGIALAQFQAISNPLGIALSMLGRGRSLVQGGGNRDEALDLLTRASRNFQALHQEQEAAEADALLKGLGSR